MSKTMTFTLLKTLTRSKQSHAVHVEDIDFHRVEDTHQEQTESRSACRRQWLSPRWRHSPGANRATQCMSKTMTFTVLKTLTRSKQSRAVHVEDNDFHRAEDTHQEQTEPRSKCRRQWLSPCWRHSPGANRAAQCMSKTMTFTVLKTLTRSKQSRAMHVEDNDFHRAEDTHQEQTEPRSTCRRQWLSPCWRHSPGANRAAQCMSKTMTFSVLKTLTRSKQSRTVHVEDYDFHRVEDTHQEQTESRSACRRQWLSPRWRHSPGANRATQCMSKTMTFTVLKTLTRSKQSRAVHVEDNDFHRVEDTHQEQTEPRSACRRQWLSPCWRHSPEENRAAQCMSKTMTFTVLKTLTRSKQSRAVHVEDNDFHRAEDTHQEQTEPRSTCRRLWLSPCWRHSPGANRAAQCMSKTMTFTVLKTLTRRKQSRTVHVEDNDFHRAEDTHQEQTEPRSTCRRQWLSPCWRHSPGANRAAQCMSKTMTFAVLKTLTRSKQSRTVHVEDNDFHRAEDTHQEQTETRSACRRQWLSPCWRHSPGANRTAQCMSKTMTFTVLKTLTRSKQSRAVHVEDNDFHRAEDTHQEQTEPHSACRRQWLSPCWRHSPGANRAAQCMSKTMTFTVLKTLTRCKQSHAVHVEDNDFHRAEDTHQEQTEPRSACRRQWLSSCWRHSPGANRTAQCMSKTMTFTVLKTLTRSKQSHAVHVEDNDFHRVEDTHQEQTEPRSACRRQWLSPCWRHSPGANRAAQCMPKTMTFTVLKTLTRSKQSRTVHAEDNDFHRVEDTHQEQTEPRSACRRQWLSPCWRHSPGANRATQCMSKIMTFTALKTLTRLQTEPRSACRRQWLSPCWRHSPGANRATQYMSKIMTFTVLKTLTRSKQSHTVHVEDNDFHRAEDTHQEQTEPPSACRRQWLSPCWRHSPGANRATQCMSKTMTFTVLKTLTRIKQSHAVHVEDNDFHRAEDTHQMQTEPRSACRRQWLSPCWRHSPGANRTAQCMSKTMTFTVLKTLTRSKQSHPVHVEDNDFHRAEDTHQEQTEPRSACRRQWLSPCWRHSPGANRTTQCMSKTMTFTVLKTLTRSKQSRTVHAEDNDFHRVEDTHQEQTEPRSACRRQWLSPCWRHSPGANRATQCMSKTMTFTALKTLTRCKQSHAVHAEDNDFHRAEDTHQEQTEPRSTCRRQWLSPCWRHSPGANRATQCMSKTMTFTVLKTLTRSKQNHAVHVEDNDFHRAEDTHQEQTEPHSACRRQWLSPCWRHSPGANRATQCMSKTMTFTVLKTLTRCKQSHAVHVEDNDFHRAEDTRQEQTEPRSACRRQWPSPCWRHSPGANRATQCMSKTMTFTVLKTLTRSKQNHAVHVEDNDFHRVEDTHQEQTEPRSACRRQWLSPCWRHSPVANRATQCMSKTMTFTVLKALTRSKQSRAVHVEDNDFHRVEDTHQEQTEPRSACRRQWLSPCWRHSPGANRATQCMSKTMIAHSLTSTVCNDVSESWAEYCITPLQWPRTIGCIKV